MKIIQHGNHICNKGISIPLAAIAFPLSNEYFQERQMISIISYGRFRSPIAPLMNVWLDVVLWGTVDVICSSEVVVSIRDFFWGKKCVSLQVSASLLWNQFRVGHHGITMIPDNFSWMVLEIDFATKLKGGKIKNFSFVNDICEYKNSDWFWVPEPGDIVQGLFIQVWSKQVYVWDLCDILWKKSGESFHSVSSLNVLDLKSATIFWELGICSAEIQHPFSLQRSQIFLDNIFHFRDTVPHIFHIFFRCCIVWFDSNMPWTFPRCVQPFVLGS